MLYEIRSLLSKFRMHYRFEFKFIISYILLFIHWGSLVVSFEILILFYEYVYVFAYTGNKGSIPMLAHQKGLLYLPTS